MTNEERHSLLRDLSDALAALQQNKSLSTLGGLADHLTRVGSPYRFHAALIQGAMQRKDHGAIMLQLVQVLTKLERGVT
jgi:hypothetical protein